ncbi:DNA-deoxyinosine glycosylase [Candidatus Ferrigenium straubiae]|jgi:hypoxanthine-DNA glycosylase|uniref:DNA-deoxyinosine glycosylase n=1 Tax=Candidatus Ferrigenium straubiae TaxID=2919506 RepID=UPI003F4AF3B7
MRHIQSFPPIERADARILILGSMPGEASLRAGQYYAHPQNLFWRIMGELLGVDPALPYEQRVEALKAAGIALWDVLHSCRRKGSLDSDIDNGSLAPNDLAAFFRRHSKITRVFFNGAKAEECYRRHVLPGIEGVSIEYLRLPSTSPANASIPYGCKLDAWRTITAA